jgi:sigma54-dependent transcription regulator
MENPTQTGDSDPAFISGTSSEFLGCKPLPRSVRSRPVIFILGPKGVGKSIVARRLFGDGALHLDPRELGDRVAQTIRARKWDSELKDCENLILDAPYFISRRPGYRKSIEKLLRQRVSLGHRTILLESQDMASMQALMDAVALEQRATLSLRFPVGRGRRRYAVKICDELGVNTCHARQMVSLDPWSYTAVRDALAQLVETPAGNQGCG